jgi:hypothetical protein
LDGMTEVKVSDLQGAALNWSVAQSVGTDVGFALMPWGIEVQCTIGEMLIGFKPSTDWVHGGPLIDKYDVELLRFGEQAWYERDPQWNQKPCVGAVIRHAPYDTISGDIHIEECIVADTRLIAACRAIVAHKIGDAIMVPTELLEVAP